jgi:hypothetical protein
MVKKVNVFFVHSKYTTERQATIHKFKELLFSFNFRNLKINKFIVVDDYDPVDIDINIIKKMVNYDKIEQPELAVYNTLLRNLHVNQLSNTMKHLKALQLISLCPDNEINIVLEDDILYEEKICLSLERLISQMPMKYDYIFLGMPTTTEMKPSVEFIFQDTHKIFKVLPLCDSYIVSPNAARATTTHYHPIKFVNNVQLSYVIDKLGLSSVQSIPNLFVDGSKYGVFVSRVCPNNPLIFNNDFSFLASLLQKNEPITKEEHDKINTLLQTSPIKNNPDFMYCECLYHTLCKNYQLAKKRYEDAYKVYMSNACIITNESQFLKDFIRVHKFLQEL